VIDLLTDPDRAREDQIIAVPTLIRELPEPIRRIIGDLSDQGEILVELLMIPRDVAR
jgi:circadian clock protein KaiB